MKIIDVKTHRLRYPLREKFANSRGWSTSRNAQIVEIATDNGLVGWGEGSGEVPRAAVEARIIGRIARLIAARFGRRCLTMGSVRVRSAASTSRCGI